MQQQGTIIEKIVEKMIRLTVNFKAASRLTFSTRPVPVKCFLNGFWCQNGSFRTRNGFPAARLRSDERFQGDAVPRRADGVRRQHARRQDAEIALRIHRLVAHGMNLLVGTRQQKRTIFPI